MMLNIISPSTPLLLRGGKSPTRLGLFLLVGLVSLLTPILNP